MKITVQKTMNVQDPARAHDTDAGLDLYVPEGQGCLVRGGAVYTIDLGIMVSIPAGHYGQLTLRSSAGKKGLTIPNGVGIIDSGYRGNIKLLVSTVAEPVLVAAGERICQLIILPLPPVDAEVGVVDDETDRGNGGFGSTGVGAAARHCTPSPLQAASLTVSGLMRELQEIALRYGNIPVVTPTTADADYEQAAVPVVMHARRQVAHDDWDLFHVAPDGEPVMVIS